VVHISCQRLQQRLRCSILDSFLGFIGIWAVFGDVPFLFPMEKIVLLPLPLSWVLFQVHLGHCSCLGTVSEMRLVLQTVGEASFAGW
jgi:hypothetical protein